MWKLFGKRRLAAPSRFRPQLEALGERVVPALTVLSSANGVLEFLSVNSGTPTKSILNQGIVILDDGSGNPGNIRVTESVRTQEFNVGPHSRQPTRRIATETFNLDATTAGRHFHTVIVRDLTSPGEGSVAYAMTGALRQGQERTVTVNSFAGAKTYVVALAGLEPGARMTVNANLSPGADTFLLNTGEVGRGASLRVNANGGEGNDSMRVNVTAPIRSGAWVDVNMEGGGGRDTIMTDAWTKAPTIEPGATLWVDQAGYLFSNNTFADGGNDVDFWYLGRMDGSLMFYLAGGGSGDGIQANLWFNSESTGTLGYPDPEGGTGTYMDGAGGDDSLRYLIRGAPIRSFPAKVVGGSGRDTLTRSAQEPDGFTLLFPARDVEDRNRRI